MRTLISSLALLTFLVLSAAADDPPADKKTPPSKKKEDQSSKQENVSLKAGNDVPGTFHPYNVTGPNKGRFHCLISEHGLDPMVMIFYKGVDSSDPLPKLLQQLDTAIEKNPSVSLDAFVVFLPDELPDVSGSKDSSNQDTNTKNDDTRLDLEKKIEQAGADMKLKRVVLCLDNKSAVAKYGLSEANLITVVLYTKLKIVAVHALSKSDFTEAAVEKIMADVADKLGAKRK